MIAVVTGTGGFVGSHLADALLARRATVRALVRRGSGAPAVPRNPRIECHTVDLADAESVAASHAWDGATHVFHAAGITKARTLAQFRAANVRPTANILAALAGRASPPRFVLVSSQAAAGPAGAADAPVREQDAPRPIEAYGISKLEAEHETHRYSDRVPSVIVRPVSVYGPRDRDFLEVFRQASARIAFYASPADQQISIVHVADAVRGLIAAAEADQQRGRTYFLANSEPVSWRELYAGVARVTGAKPFAVQLPGAALHAAAAIADFVGALTGRTFLLNGQKEAMARPAWWTVDAARARAELAWREHELLQVGLRDTYVWYVQAGWLRGRRSPHDPRSHGDTGT